MPPRTRKLIVGLAVTVPVAIVVLIVVTICLARHSTKEAPSQIASVGSLSRRPLDPERTVSDGSLFYLGLPIGNDELIEYLGESGLVKESFEARLLDAYAAGRLLMGTKVISKDGTYSLQLVGVPFPGMTDRSGFPDCSSYGVSCYVIDEYGMLGPRVLLASGAMGTVPVAFLDNRTVLLRSRFWDGPSNVERMTALNLETDEEMHVSKSSSFDGGGAVYSEEVIILDPGWRLDARTVIVPGSRDRYQTEIFGTVADQKRLLLTVRRKDVSTREGVRHFTPIEIDFEAFLRNPQRVQLKIDDQTYSFAANSSTISSVR